MILVNKKLELQNITVSAREKYNFFHVYNYIRNNQYEPNSTYIHSDGEEHEFLDSTGTIWVFAGVEAFQRISTMEILGLQQKNVSTDFVSAITKERMENWGDTKIVG